MKADLITHSVSNEVSKEGVITEILMSKSGTLLNEMGRWITDTRETLIRQSLIELGWTPPDDGHNP
jgi:hypothetical protein